MTYRQLIKALDLLPDAALDHNITIQNLETNEIIPVTYGIISEMNDSQIVLYIEGE